MAKSLNELSNELKEFMIRIQSDVRDKQNAFRPERYNNLKIDMNVARDITPQVRISMGMSEVSYDLRTGIKPEAAWVLMSDMSKDGWRSPEQWKL